MTGKPAKVVEVHPEHHDSGIEITFADPRKGNPGIPWIVGLRSALPAFVPIRTATREGYVPFAREKVFLPIKVEEAASDLPMPPRDVQSVVPAAPEVIDRRT
ncbi:MAG TPA: hypothetical protein VFC52_01625 [Solirubrobacterales bacterium]|nr:hypothetical protein [Solirubrobacterales bacterium]